MITSQYFYVNVYKFTENRMQIGKFINYTAILHVEPLISEESENKQNCRIENSN